ncbi:MAG TPA: hypothetical protein VM425_00595 [Myxococcota bacterium]|nr:hypothetical protein [Myxococcota bacterium]
MSDRACRIGCLLVPESTVRFVSGPLLRSATDALVDVARSFSPRVSGENAGKLCLDLGGLANLYPSEHKLGSAMLLAAERVGLPARVGIGASRLVAELAARTTDSVQIVPRGEERSFLDPLPLSLLHVPEPLAAALRRFGIECFAELAALPPRGLGLRLGYEGLRLWREARGEETAPLVSERPPERIVEEGECDLLCRIEPLLMVLQSLCVRLAARLSVRGLVACGLFLGLDLDPVGKDERRLGLASPCRDVRAWIGVARLSLEESPPPAPVTSLRIEADVLPERRAQLDLFEPRVQAATGLDDALARLAALSGEDRVGSPRALDSHRPGAFALEPFKIAAGGKVRGAQESQAQNSGPFVLAVRPAEEARVAHSRGHPVSLASRSFHGRVVRLAGPWRFDSGWWRDDPLGRDYYEMELTGGDVFRVFFDHGRRRWFVDGICG